MRNIALSITVLGTMLVPLLHAAPAHAQASRTWVSGVGDDANPCSRTAPCKTFAGAISKTAVNGEINCLDPGGFGALTITKSITVDCHDVFGSTLNAGTTAFIINFNSFAGTDVRKSVRLRNINMQGVNSGTNGVRIIGGTVTGGSVFIEDCLIDGNFTGTSMRGITDERTGGGELTVTNTTIRNLGGSGIHVQPATGSSTIFVAIHNVRVHNANIGIFGANGVRMMVNSSVVSGNTTAGFQVDGPLANSQMNINGSVSTANGDGVRNGGGTVIIRLSNNDINYNQTGITGATNSFGNNRISANSVAGTAPTLLLPASSELRPAVRGRPCLVVAVYSACVASTHKSRRRRQRV